MEITYVNKKKITYHSQHSYASMLNLYFKISPKLLYADF